MRSLVVCLAVLGAVQWPVQAEPPSTNAGSSGSSLTIPEGFDSQSRTLQPGDRLEINIFSLPELEKQYQVRADGTFYHPHAGEVLAAGKTLKQISALLTQRFRKQLRNPEFRLGLVQMAEAEATVLGEVRTQGKFKFGAGTSVIDLLAMAGGLGDKADRDSAVLMRAGKEIPLNLNPAGQAEMARLMVRSGDTIFINRGKRVSVFGEVQAKGVYTIGSRSQNSVEEAIKAAGGMTETAALNRIQVSRPSLGETPILVNYLNPQDVAKVALEDGDVIRVPARSVVVLGAVNKQGALPLNGTETLMDVVSQAGVGQARLDSVVVVRSADVLAGNDKKEVYNLEKFFTEGAHEGPAINVPIRDGDMVFLPQKEASTGGLFGGGNLLNLLIMARSLFAF
ncbi:SLBB domain-containing protein [bacterium]|nr:SLBB domain-containing protein [bacterium]